MKLFAISDLHVGHGENRRVLEELPARPDDWLLLCGDVADTLPELEEVLRVLGRKFARLLWVPGNHELWALPRAAGLRGVARYERMVELCRARGVVTPEDPFPLWEGEGGPHLLAPLFLLYDYSFRPDHVPVEEAVAWARAERIYSTDERLLDPEPFDSVPEWCASRCEETERRLEKALAESPHPSVLMGHFPLRQELAVLPRIPRYMVWCGTRRTEDWHLRFRARVVVSGHLHIPSTRHVDGVRFEEVSLGYPPEWERRRRHRGWRLRDHLRQILPIPASDAGDPLRLASSR